MRKRGCAKKANAAIRYGVGQMMKSPVMAKAIIAVQASTFKIIAYLLPTTGCSQDALVSVGHVSGALAHDS